MQEGFLLGEARCHSVENITDSQAAGTREEKKLCEHCACVHVCVCVCVCVHASIMMNSFSFQPGIQSFVCFQERFRYVCKETLLSHTFPIHYQNTVTCY